MFALVRMLRLVYKLLWRQIVYFVRRSPLPVESRDGCERVGSSKGHTSAESQASNLCGPIWGQDDRRSDGFTRGHQ